MSTALQDATLNDSASKVTRDLKDKLVIQDDASAPSGGGPSLPEADTSLDSDAGEDEPGLTSKMLANADVEEDDDDDEYVFEEQDSRATDATSDEEEDLEATTAAVLSELAELRQEQQDNDSDPTKCLPLHSADEALLPESEDEAVETDSEMSSSDSEYEQSEESEAVATTGPNPTLLRLMQETDLSDDDSEDDEYVPST